MKQKALFVGLLFLLWVVASVTVVFFPLVYLVRGREAFRILSQSANVLFGGYARESFSSRMGRTGEHAKIASWVNTALPGHTEDAAQREQSFVTLLVVTK